MRIKKTQLGIILRNVPGAVVDRHHAWTHTIGDVCSKERLPTSAFHHDRIPMRNAKLGSVHWINVAGLSAILFRERAIQLTVKAASAF